MTNQWLAEEGLLLFTKSWSSGSLPGYPIARFCFNVSAASELILSGRQIKFLDDCSRVFPSEKSVVSNRSTISVSAATRHSVTPSTIVAIWLTIFSLGETRVQAFYDWLIARDENYELIKQLPLDELQREREFIGNSLRGMAEYVAGLSEAERKRENP